MVTVVVEFVVANTVEVDYNCLVSALSPCKLGVLTVSVTSLIEGAAEMVLVTVVDTTLVVVVVRSGCAAPVVLSVTTAASQLPLAQTVVVVWMSLVDVFKLYFVTVEGV